MTNSRFNLIVVTAIICLPASAVAADNSADATTRALPNDAGQIVRQALLESIDGSPAVHRRLLERAVRSDGDNRPARWHNGFVEENGEWVHFSQIEEQSGSTEAVAEYRRLRAKMVPTYAGHLALAKYCRRHGLPRRERAHLIAALELSDNPNDGELRRRAGFELHGNRWATSHEIAEARELARSFERELPRWFKQIDDLTRRLKSSNPRARRTAEDELKAIKDPAALPALELALLRADLHEARLLVDVLAGMDTHWASVFLARQTILSPYKTIRAAAAGKLEDREPGEYAPLLLASLHTPVESRTSLYVDSTGVYLFQAFLQEHQDQKQVLALKSQTRFQYYVATQIPAAGFRTDRGASANYARAWARALNRNAQELAVSTAVESAKIRGYVRERATDGLNDVVEELNARAISALRTATGVQLPAEPQHWWRWWTDFNEMYSSGEKPCYYYCQSENFTDPVPVAQALPMSCLVAGTPVWTDHGPTAVEDVKVGDLALSQNPRTGELSYQPVLRTTVRPGHDLWRIRAGAMEFQGTGGHVFWIAGEGWKRLRDVKPGMRFHGADGPVEVVSAVKEGNEPTYNLVVADFHSYFVGDEMILSHDPTFAKPTDLRLPGLDEGESLPVD